jgi:hypothetical protein
MTKQAPSPNPILETLEITKILISDLGRDGEGRGTGYLYEGG